MSKKDKTFVATIYGYDNMYHEKYQCSVDYFIDNYKEFARDDFFWIFHSKEERDSFALNSYYDELIHNGNSSGSKSYTLPDDSVVYNPVARKDAKDYLDGLKEINLDKAVSS